MPDFTAQFLRPQPGRRERFRRLILEDKWCQEVFCLFVFEEMGESGGIWLSVTAVEEGLRCGRSRRETDERFSLPAASKACLEEMDDVRLWKAEKGETCCWQTDGDEHCLHWNRHEEN